MAEFALGLTKTVVDGTLSRVKSAIEEETRLKEKVQHDLVFITGEFQMMQSFLNVANKERAKNQVVRTWVRQLRDLAFDVEDCVEFVVHLDNKPAWWWRMVPSCVAPPRHGHLDEAAAEIKQLKDRVEDVSQRNTRYNLISDSGSRSKSITAAEEQTPGPAATASPTSAFPLLRKVWWEAGRMRDINNLQDLLTGGSSDLQVISVWGSTAGGDTDPRATSMLRKAYYDKNVRQEFKIRLWIKPTHPFNRDEFLHSLVVQLCTSSSQHETLVGMDFRERMKAAMATQDHLMIKAEQLMKENRYLVVLEQVSTLLEWDAIKMCLPDYKNGSRIVMSTHDLGAALMCTGEPYEVAELRQFSQGQSICAFFKTVSSCRHRDIDELKRLIKRRGVISVHGRTMSKVLLVKKLYHHIKHDRTHYIYMGFRWYSWVNVSSPLNKVDFARRLLLDLDDDHACDIPAYGHDADGPEDDVEVVDQDDSDDLQANEVVAVDLDLIKNCCETLHKKNYLLVIDGLQSTEDWDWIKDTFLSQPIKGCIIVVTNEERVAKHCVEDEEDRALNCEYLQAKGPRMKEALDWRDKFELAGCMRVEINYLDNSMHSVVWGIAGTGKSDFVRNYYYHRMISMSDLPLEEKRFYYGWVDVHHPFNLSEFSLNLLMDLHSDDLQAKEVAAVSIIEGQDPIQGCRNILRQYSCFVVFDGLRTKDEWDMIRSGPLNGALFRTTAVVITNEATLASYCARNDHMDMINFKCLEADEALHLFMKIISPKKIPTPREMELSQHILAKCGGLPEVITAIGKYCRFGYEYKLKKLKNINENFMEILETDDLYFDCLRGLFSWMQCYFEDCKDSLKPCIFYLPVFPTNHNFRRRRLLRRWIAEGYSRDTSSGTAEENGERMFSELVDLSILQQPSSKSLCRVNGFFHEYITSRPMEDNLVFALEGHCSLNSELVGKHLSIRKSWDRDNNVFESIDFASLRSLTVFGEWRPIFMSTNVNMRLLRVLDLEDTSNVRDEDIEQIGKLVPRLKFLSLRGCRGITRLPNSFGGLRQLQTLDARHSSIATLPQAIIKLLKLQYIRVGTSKQPWDEGGRVTSISTDGASTSQQVAPTQAEEGASTNSSQLASPGVVRASMHSRIRPHTMLSRWLSKLSGKTQHHDNCGVDVPARIGKLTALHTLGVISVSGEGGKAIVMELQTLSRLRRLGLCGINRENFKEFWSAISGHGHLESLSVQVDEDREHGLICCFDDTIAPPPKYLKSLKLYGYVHILPVGWIKQLDNLKMLDLEMTVLRQQDIDVLDELQNRDAICRLCVRLTNEGEIQFRTPINRPFYYLEVLEIDCTSKFQVTFLPVQQFNYVKVLKVHCSSGSSLQIFGIVNLELLKNVWLKGSYRDELKEDLRRQLSRNRKHPVLNLVQQCLS